VTVRLLSLDRAVLPAFTGAVLTAASRRDTPFVEPRFYGTGVETQAFPHFQVGYARGASWVARSCEAESGPSGTKANQQSPPN
jgi:hypothetical protein